MAAGQVRRTWGTIRKSSEDLHERFNRRSLRWRRGNSRLCYQITTSGLSLEPARECSHIKFVGNFVKTGWINARPQTQRAGPNNKANPLCPFGLWSQAGTNGRVERFFEPTARAAHRFSD